MEAARAEVLRTYPQEGGDAARAGFRWESNRIIKNTEQKYPNRRQTD